MFWLDYFPVLSSELVIKKYLTISFFQVTEESGNISVHSKKILFFVLPHVHRVPLPRIATQLCEKGSCSSCFGKEILPGGATKYSSTTRWAFLQHSCLLPHCQISSIDICPPVQIPGAPPRPCHGAEPVGKGDGFFQPCHGLLAAEVHKR